MNQRGKNTASAKLHSIRIQTLHFQTGKELISLNDTKIQLEKMYTQVGVTDWEIHLNKTRYLHENEFKQEYPKSVSIDNKNTQNVDNNTAHSSDYWLG